MNGVEWRLEYAAGSPKIGDCSFRARRGSVDGGNEKPNPVLISCWECSRRNLAYVVY